MSSAVSASVSPAPAAAHGGDHEVHRQKAAASSRILGNIDSTLQGRIASLLGLKFKEDLRTLFFTACYFALFFYMWFAYPRIVEAGIYSSTSLLHFPLWLTLCYLSFLGAVATHNCIHCPMFVSRIPNRIFQVTLSLVYGHPVTSYVPGHNLSHHKYTQQRKDVMRTTKLQFRWHLLNGIFFFFKIGIDMISNDSRYFQIQKKLGRPVIKQLEIEQYILWACTAFFFLWDWRRWIVIAFMPHIYAKFCIISLNLLQHDGCDAESRYNFSRNFTGKWLNYFCYNNGYHTIHHLHPGLHWSVLPQRHEVEIIPYMAPSLDQPFILTYIFKTFIYPGIRIDYEGNPWQPPTLEPDEPWFYDTTETYSTGEKNE